MGLISDAFGGGDAKDAAKAAAQGYREAESAYKGAESEALQRFTPYADVGKTGANALLDLYANPGSFREDPGYQFAFNEGQRAVDSSGAARGMALSGAQLKALNRYGQGTADQQFNNVFSRNFNLANMGMNSANSMGNINLQTAQNVGNARIGVGQARASGYLAKAGIKNGIANSLLDAGLSYATGGLSSLGGKGGGSGYNPGGDWLGEYDFG